MKKRDMAVWGFLLSGALFLAAGLLPVLDGQGVDPTRIAVAILFVIVSAVIARSSRRRP